MTVKLTSNPRGLTVGVKVVPASSKNSLVGVEGEFLKVRVTAPPVEGRANRMVVELLSKWLMMPKSRIHITKGLASKRKMILIENCDAAQFNVFLSRLNS